MFWQAVFNGLSVLFHWQSLLAVLLFGVLLVIPLILVGLLMAKSPGAGCLSSLLLLPLFQVFATLVVTWSLSPIILGMSDQAAWELPWQMLAQDPGWVVGVVLKITVSAFLASIVPVLGRLPTFTNSIIAGLSIAYVADAAMAANANGQARLDRWPGFWMSFGFLICGLIAMILGMFAVSFLKTVRQTPLQRALEKDAPPGPLSMAVASFLGLLPAFMYGAWLGLQIRA